MTRARRWKVVAITVGVVVALGGATALVTDAWSRATESTYYGRQTNLLRVGEHVVFTEDCAVGDQHISKAQAATVREEPAWDEDSCDPDRPIAVELSSGERVSVPRHVLHRKVI
jgi:hypothetical protein